MSGFFHIRTLFPENTFLRVFLPDTMKPILFTLAISLLLSASIQAQEPSPPSGLAALEQKILYHPRKYAPSVTLRFLANGGKRVTYQTPQGNQSAWLLAPTSGTPERLWLIFGGNGSLALDMEPLCRSLSFSKDAWLLVDYPGYGECEGLASPASIRENAKSSAEAALELLRTDNAKMRGKIRVFGHSLGCAAALLAADIFQADAAVLCAPFTSTEDMARLMVPLPPETRLTHIFDNRQGLAALEKHQGKAWILHGKADEVIPVTMGETLAKEFPKTVKLTIIPGGHHNDLFERAANELRNAMEQARR